MQIVIKKTYFDNIKIAIDAMNKFFASGFKTKAFPVVNDDFQLDRIIARTLSWLNNIEPEWIENPQKAVEALEQLKSFVNGQTELEREVHEADESEAEDPTMQPSKWDAIMNGTNKVATDVFHAFVGFKVLQYITEHFDQFEQLLNGIYSFELFTKPSMYREAIQTFTSPIPMPELEKIEPFPGEYKLFTADDYVGSIFDNDQIKLPDDMMADTETQRFQQMTDIPDCEIVIDETVQEAAAINYFESTKPEHIKFDTKTKKWKISKQFESAVNALLSALRKCDTTEDVANYFSKVNESSVMMFANNVMPYLYGNLFTVKKDQWKNPATESEAFQNYAKSYASIIQKNNGAKRFARYDVFSTFRTDKDGTIQFLEDFLKLNLVNKESIAISNSMILTLFNIFDSRIYLDIMYNLIPDDIKEKEYPTEDGFVKKIRARINQNSHEANPYQDEKKSKETIETSDQVVEYVHDMLMQYNDMTRSDMRYCNEFDTLIDMELASLGDSLYNESLSAIKIDHYLNECQSIFQEIEAGDIPTYMRKRIALDTERKKEEQKKQPEENKPDSPGEEDPFMDIQLPPDIPMNDIDDLADSIDARVNTPGADSLSEMLGSGYQGQVKPPQQGGRGTVVYNITYNVDSHNVTTTNDLSTGKTIKTSHIHRPTSQAENKASNNYDNTRPSSNSKESTDTFSNGKSVQEVFALLDSKEPLFVESDAGTPPKGDLLTTAMDVDRRTLPVLQKAKRGVNKVLNYGKALTKPVSRSKQMVRNIVDSAIKRDEDRVKDDMLENPSYRSAIYKVARLALKTGAFAIFTKLSPLLGVGYLATQGLKLADRDRLRKEANNEIATEIQIIDDKIRQLKEKSYYGAKDESKRNDDQKELYQLMRMRGKLIEMYSGSRKRQFSSSDSVY